jgi:hypothetical protein
MALVSTFEVVLKPQLPTDLPPVLNTVRNLGRNVIQGYFLTIANINSIELVLSLVFTTILPPGVDLDEIITFTDVSGTNASGGPLVSDGVGNKYRFSPLILPAGATALFILQPVPTDLALVNLDIEARGFVEIFLSSLSGTTPAGVEIQVTAEQRGTFFANALGATIADRSLDQIAYSLPVQNGGRISLN